MSRLVKLPYRVATVIARVTMTQIFFAPVICTYFFGAQALLAGEGPRGIWRRVRRTVPRAWRNGLLFWPFVQAASFAWIGVHYRALFNNAAGVIWQTYVAYLNRATEDEKRALAEAIPEPEKGGP